MDQDATADPASASDVARFRRAERTRLYALRKHLPTHDRAAQATSIAAGLTGLLGTLEGLVVAVYWPILGEPDLRDWMTRASDAGARIVLPVVTRRHAPLVFLPWSPQAPMTRGMFGIPVPADGDPVVPEVVIAPLVAADDDGYRLGNGGGYYDRTLAAFPELPRRVGVGHDFARIPTIRPMPWDIPMTDTVFGDDSAHQHS